LAAGAVLSEKQTFQTLVNRGVVTFLMDRLNPFLAKELLLISQGSERIRHILRDRRFLDKHRAANLDILHVFDFLVSPSGRRFRRDFDDLVRECLKSHNFLEFDKYMVAKLAFRQNQEGHPAVHLYFPSLLAYGGNLVIDSAYDRWVCGRYIISKWIAESRKSRSQFPHIERIERLLLLPPCVLFVCLSALTGARL
jgi:hypothetical protein